MLSVLVKRAKNNTTKGVVLMLLETYLHDPLAWNSQRILVDVDPERVLQDTLGLIRDGP